jgi:hypothetical protein
MSQKPPDNPPKRPRWKLWIALGLLLAVGTSAAVTFAFLRFYTDGLAIYQPTRLSSPREVLWEPPVTLAKVSDAATDNYEPSVSADGQTLVFARGQAKHNADLMISRKVDGAWSDPQPLTEINTDADELGPELSRDGKHLYFYSDRAGGLGGYDIWVSAFDSQHWLPAVNLGPAVNTEFDEEGPAVGFDNGLYFSSNRPRRELTEAEKNSWRATLRELHRGGDYDIFVAPVLPPLEAPGLGNGSPAPGADPALVFAQATRVDELNSRASQGQLAFTPRGDFVYFSSNRAGGLGGYDIYRSRILHGHFQSPENLGSPVNTAADDMDPALAVEGYGLVFSSNRQTDPANKFQLYQSTSREVVAITDTAGLQQLWALLDRIKWPLLVLVIAAALLALMARMMRGRADLAMSLLRRCILASLVLHVLIALLLSTWIITTEIYDAAVKEPMEVSVNVDSLSEEKVALEIREQVSEVKQSDDTIKADIQIARLPVPEVEPVQEAAAQALQGPAFVAEPVVTQPTAPARTADAPEPHLDPAPDLRQIAALLPAPQMKLETQPDPKPAAAPAPQPAAVADAVNFTPTNSASPAESAPQPLASSSPMVRSAEPSGSPLSAIKLETPPLTAAPATLDAGPRPVAGLVALGSLEAAPSVQLEMRAPAPGTAAAEPKGIADPLASSSPMVRSAEPSGSETPAAAGLTPGSVLDLSKLADASAATGAASAVASPSPDAAALAAGRADSVSTLPVFRNTPGTAALTPISPEVATALEIGPTRKGLGAGAQPTPPSPMVRSSEPSGSPLALPAGSGRPVADASTSAAGSAKIAGVTDGSASALTEAPPPSTPVFGTGVTRQSLPAFKIRGDDTPGSLPAVAGLKLESRSGPSRVGTTESTGPKSLTADGGVARPAELGHGNGGGGPLVASLGVSNRQPSSLEKSAVGEALVASASPRAGKLDGALDVLGKGLPALPGALAVHLETAQVKDTEYALRNPSQRKKIIERLGGGKDTEEGVARALDWFSKHQEEDGRWSISKHGGEGGHDNASTAFAMLCYFGWGAKHTEAGPHQQTLIKAVNWLASQVKPNGDLTGDNGHGMYDQGVATMALAEAYGLTKDPALKDPLERAVAFIIKAQSKSHGGWRYRPGDGDGDMSVVGWQVMALRSARMAGIDVPDEPFALAAKWIDRCASGEHKGRYGYQPGGPTPPMTAEGMFCQQLLGVGPQDPRMQESAAYVLTALPTNGDHNYYYWYYGCLSMYQHGGDAWEKWNDTVKPLYLASQVRDGDNAGSWNPAGQWGGPSGRVVTTAMATLSLEVYYRYLPMYKTEFSKK